MKIKELLERVEGLSGPDREVDAELFSALDPTFPHGAFRMLLAHDTATFGTDAYTNVKAPLYTASIDAALALVERKLPGWRIYLSVDAENGSTDDLAAGRICGASVCSPMRQIVGEYGMPDVESDDFYAAATKLPLAIITALLRALLAKGE